MGKYSAARDLDLANNTHWYLVANRTQAAIYRNKKRRRLEFVERLFNPQGRSKDSELDSDKSGRSFSSTRGAHISHSLEQSVDHHETVARQFAAQIADYLVTAAGEGRFRGLVVVAEPRFLGILRGVFPNSIKSKVHREIAKEYRPSHEKQLRQWVRAGEGVLHV